MDVDLVYVATKVHEAAILLVEMLELLAFVRAHMSCILLEGWVIWIKCTKDEVGADPALSDLRALVCEFVHIGNCFYHSLCEPDWAYENVVARDAVLSEFRMLLIVDSDGTVQRLFEQCPEPHVIFVGVFNLLEGETALSVAEECVV